MGKNLMKSNQISGGRTQNGVFGHKSDMELILCFIICLKNKKRASYTWECWANWNDVHRLQLWSSEKTGSKSICSLLVIKMPTKAPMIVKPLLFVFAPGLGDGYVLWVINKGPGDKTYEDGGVWGFPGVTKCYEEDENHLGRHVLKIQQSHVAHVSHQSESDFYPTTTDFWWRCQKLCKDRGGTWAQLKTQANFH